jgi:acyl-CoA thioesterase-1
MKILIVADSNGMPRNEISYEDTWVFKLINNFPAFHFIDRSKRASTVERLTTEGGDVTNVKQGADLLEYYAPDIVILQLGIVDCSPRYVNKNNFFVKLLYRSPKKIQSVIFSLIKKYTVRKPKYAFVSQEKFRKALEEYITRAMQKQTRILAITIAPPTDEFVRKSPHIGTSIAAYNNIYNHLSTQYSNFFVVDPFNADININSIALDEFHVNSEGNSIVFRNVKEALQKLT